jgi:hypothetical protein
MCNVKNWTGLGWLYILQRRVFIVMGWNFGFRNKINYLYN